MEYLGDRNGNRVPDPEEIGIRQLEGDGDFRSPECIELLKQADIVVTNPPFSLFREYVAQLIKYDKKFTIIGHQGVPDTFLDKYNPDQFEIVGLGCGDLAKLIGVGKNHRGRTDVAFKVNGEYKCPYSRIIIRRRK